MTDLLLLTWTLVAGGVFILLFLVQTYNRFVAARNACGNARSGIDVQLTKRHDLVPNLVRAVEGYTAHERNTLLRLTEARALAARSLGNAASPAAESGLDQALSTVIARVEAYPELKASDNFLHLQKSLTEIEEQISAARRAFNAHVMQLNNLAGQFPTNLVAGLLGFQSMDYFESAANDRVTPTVALGPDGRGR